MNASSETIENCYISIDIEEDHQFKEIYKSLSETLNRLEVPHSVSPRPHVSIAYTLGFSKKKFFEQILLEMAQHPFSFKPTGIVFIIGENTNKDYIGLKLAQEGDFFMATKTISDKCPIKVFKNGFISHISLFEVPKGVLSEETFYLISRYLESTFANLMLISNKIQASSISAFNKSREKQLEFKIRAIKT